MIVEVVAMQQIHFSCQVQIAFIVITSSIARQFEGNFVSKILNMWCKGKGKFEFKIIHFSREIPNSEMVPKRLYMSYINSNKSERMEKKLYKLYFVHECNK